jgi:eukaryotic-like serine/threonine-protein kinase
MAFEIQRDAQVSFRAAREPVQAVKLAQAALNRSPRKEAFQKTLGVAHYRCGHWAEATAVLEAGSKARGGGDTTAKLFRAMARWNNGGKGEARKWYTEAIDWMEMHKSQDHELLRFRAEAEDLLGIADSRMPNGIDAFAKE